MLFLNSASNEKIAKFSPDGRYVAYLSDESGRDELYVRQFPSGASRWPVSTGGASQVRWSRSGNELFYVEAGSLMAVTVTAGAGFAVGSATRLFSHPAFTASFDANYDVSRGRAAFPHPSKSAIREPEDPCGSKLVRRVSKRTIAGKSRANPTAFLINSNPGHGPTVSSHERAVAHFTTLGRICARLRQRTHMERTSNAASNT